MTLYTAGSRLSNESNFMWEWAKKTIIGPVIKAGYSLATAADAGLQTAAALITSGKGYAGTFGAIFGVTEGAGAWFFQGKSISEYFNPNAKTEYENIDNQEGINKCSSYSAQVITLALKTGSLATDRYFAWQLVAQLIEGLSVGALTGGAFWGVYGTSLAMAILSKIVLADGYSVTQGIAAKIEKNEEAKSMLAPLLGWLQEHDKARTVLKACMLEGAVMEDLVPYITMMLGFNLNGKDLKTGTAITSVVALLLAPFLVTQTWVYDAQKAFEENVDNADGNFPLSDDDKKINCGGCSGLWGKSTAWVSSIARPTASGIGNFLAMRALGAGAGASGAIGGTIGVFLALGNYFSEGQAAEEMVADGSVQAKASFVV